LYLVAVDLADERRGGHARVVHVGYGMRDVPEHLVRVERDHVVQPEHVVHLPGGGTAGAQEHHGQHGGELERGQHQAPGRDLALAGDRGPHLERQLVAQVGEPAHVVAQERHARLQAHALVRRRVQFHGGRRRVVAGRRPVRVGRRARMRGGARGGGARGGVRARGGDGRAGRAGGGARGGRAGGGARRDDHFGRGAGVRVRLERRGRVVGQPRFRRRQVGRLGRLLRRGPAGRADVEHGQHLQARVGDARRLLFRGGRRGGRRLVRVRRERRALRLDRRLFPGLFRGRRLFAAIGRRRFLVHHLVPVALHRRRLVRVLQHVGHRGYAVFEHRVHLHRRAVVVVRRVFHLQLR